MLNLRKTLSEVTSLFQSNQIHHALIGGFALSAYGEFRSTVDIDFLIDGSKKDLAKSLLLANGYKLQFESKEVLQFTGTGYVDVLLANRPMSLEMLKNANQNKDLGVYVVKPEDIIGLKIQAYKNDSSRIHQDKADIQGLLKLKNLDMILVKKYADIFGEWDEILKLKGLNK